MHYTIHANKIADLVLRGNHVHDEYTAEQGYRFNMYVWILKGGPRPILVDTGPKSIEEINRGLGNMVIEPVRQAPGEDLPSILARNDVDPKDVSHVFFTHLHYDHCTNYDLFPNAQYVVNKRGFEEALRRLSTIGPWIPGEVLFPFRDELKDRVLLVEEAEPVPGIRTFWLGGHTPCSQAIVVETGAGTAVIAGDVVSVYENIEKNKPVGVGESAGESLAGMARIREIADIVLPSHDPEVLVRHPGGVIG